MENRVKYGLSNAHYAIIEEVDGVITYGKPIRLPGAVNLTMEPQGEATEFYADNMLYYGKTTNTGYEATLELAILPEGFKTGVLGDKIDGNGFILEDSKARSKNIALLFEFSGDQKETRHCLRYCSVARPSDGSSTTTATAEPVTQELVLRALPHPLDGYTKITTGEATSKEAYDAFFTDVPTITIVPEDGAGGEVPTV